MAKKKPKSKPKTKKNGLSEKPLSKERSLPKSNSQANPVGISQEEKIERISKIEEGTVIDHLPIETVFKVADILKLTTHPNLVSIATNLPSKKMGRKAIIKIEKRFLSEDEVNKISVFAPDATVALIRSYQVKEKGKVELPKVIENVIRCSNPSCITNHERVQTKFLILEKDPLKVNCEYCERPMTQPEIEIV